MVDMDFQAETETAEIATSVPLNLEPEEKEIRNLKPSHKTDSIGAVEAQVETEAKDSGDEESDRVKELETEIQNDEVSIDVNRTSAERLYQVRTYGSPPGASVIEGPKRGEVRFNHSFQWKTYWSPTWCQVCEKLLVGIYKQGLECSTCKQNVHYDCMSVSDKELSCISSVTQTVSF